MNDHLQTVLQAGGDGRISNPTMNAELQIVLDQARTTPLAEIPRLLGDLMEISATAQARLCTPALAPAAPDQLLDVRAAASRLGCSVDSLYKRDWPFVVRVGRRRMYSQNKIEEFIRKSRPL